MELLELVPEYGIEYPGPHSLTEKTRASYPFSHLLNYLKSGMACHPLFLPDLLAIMPENTR